MNKKLLLLLTLTVGQAVAMEPMELTIDAQPQNNMPDTTEQKVVITIEDQERELPARYISLSGTLAGLTNTADAPTSTEFYKEGTPLPKVSLATWQLIENQLERVYRSTQGDTLSRDEIIAEYTQLDSRRLIDLIKAVEFLDIILLKEITLELAQNKLTFDEMLGLPAYMRNEVIKRKASNIAGPVLLKEMAVCRGAYHSVCVTPDGKIVSGSIDKTVRVWDMNGQELAVCRGHENWVTSVCVTPDGKIISGSYDNTVRLWDMNGQELAICRGHENAVRSVCVTPDSKIVSGSWDDTVRIWDMTGQELAVCRGHDGPIESVCVTPDGKIVSGSEDDTARIWDMTGQELAVCRGHKGWVYSVCVTSDGKIVSGSFDNTVRIWDINGQELAVFRGHEKSVFQVCVTTNGKIVSGSGDETVRICDMNGKQLAVCKGHEHGVTLVCITAEDKIVSGSIDKTVRLWDMNGQELAVCRGNESAVGQVYVTTDGKIVSGSNDNTLHIWDISLLNRLSIMNKEQAQAVCKLLQSATCENQEQKEQCWKEIANIFEEEELPNLSKWRSAGAIKLMLILSVSIIALWYLDHCENQKHKEQCRKEIPKILEEQELVSETKNGKES